MVERRFMSYRFHKERSACYEFAGTMGTLWELLWELEKPRFCKDWRYI